MPDVFTKATKPLCQKTVKKCTHERLPAAAIMAGRASMPPSRDPDFLLAMQQELETFIHSLRHPIVVEDEVELFDLTAARWKLTVEFGKLLFEAWNTARSIARRVEDVAYRDRGRIGVFARKPGGLETGTLEFRDFEHAGKAGRARDR